MDTTIVTNKTLLPSQQQVPLQGQASSGAIVRFRRKSFGKNTGVLRARGFIFFTKDAAKAISHYPGWRYHFPGDEAAPVGHG